MLDAGVVTRLRRQSEGIMKRGSIELARRLCVEIAGFADEENDIDGYDYGSVDIAEILSAEVERLRAIEQSAINLCNVKGRHHSAMAMTKLLQDCGLSNKADKVRG